MKKQSIEVSAIVISSRSSEIQVLKSFVEMDNGPYSLDHLLNCFLLHIILDGRNFIQDCFAGVCFLQSSRNN